MPETHRVARAATGRGIDHGARHRRSGGDGDDIISDAYGYNTLRGGNGNDTITGRGILEGGAGNDTLTGSGIFAGGTGDDLLIASDAYSSDTYLFNLGDGHDTINDFGYSDSKDKLCFGTGVDYNELWFSRAGNDLAINVIGTSDQITINSWFSSGYYQIGTIQAGDGKALIASQVQNLVNAMASFAPPAPGQTSLATDYQQALNPVLAANWK